MRQNKQYAFTIVELLVVIVVIAVLAAITIVSYTGINQRAVAVSLQSDLNNAATQLKLFYVDNNLYPGTIRCDIPDSSINKCVKSSNETTYVYSVNNGTNPPSFQLVATDNGTSYVVTEDTSPVVYNPPPQPVIAVGYNDNTCYISSSRTLMCWGRNASGEIGDNTSGTNRLVPTNVNIANGVSSLYGKTIISVDSGSNFTCALDSDGAVHCWGANNYGQLGDNSTTPHIVPATVNTANGLSALYGKTTTSIAVGGSHVCALDSQGKVYCWGQNFYGQLGDNSETSRQAPVAVNTANGVSALYGKTIVGISAGDGHTCAVDSNGLAYCWGQDGSGQIGDNGSVFNKIVPLAVNTTNGLSSLYGKTVSSVVAGGNLTCALDSTGAVHCWGQNNHGQLGINSTSNSLVPVAVNISNGVSSLYGKTATAVASGQFHACALDSTGAVHCWGQNISYGALGDNTFTDRLVPVLTDTTNGVSSLYNKTVVAIAAGDLNSCALDSTGAVHCWGYNGAGQVGNNTTGSYQKVPAQTSNLP